MGFMDKAKEAALQAKASAEKMAQQGQAKVATMQESRSVGELYRTLGEAVYAEQRHGGDRAAVGAALDALDQHFAASAGPGAAATSPPPAGGAAPTQTPPAGDFTIDDV
jgi:hypothetical protein